MTRHPEAVPIICEIAEQVIEDDADVVLLFESLARTFGLTVFVETPDGDPVATHIKEQA